LSFFEPQQYQLNITYLKGQLTLVSFAQMAQASAKLFHLLSSLRQESSSGACFIVYEDLKQAVDRNLVSDVLEGFFQPEHRRATATLTIIEKGLKTFSILAWMRQENLITHFMENNELDARLPMEESQVRRVSNEVAERFWTEVQWEFLPHEFRKADYHRVIRNKVILPFTGETKMAEGASGEIYKSALAGPLQFFLPGKVPTTQFVQLFVIIANCSG